MVYDHRTQHSHFLLLHSTPYLITPLIIKIRVSTGLVAGYHLTSPHVALQNWPKLIETLLAKNALVEQGASIDLMLV